MSRFARTLLASFLASVATPCVAVLADETQAYFVAPSGSPAGPGTMASPYQTIAQGLAAANASATRKRVIVAQGTYGEALTIPCGVGLYGGFNPSAGWSRAQGNTTTIAFTSFSIQQYPVRIANCSARTFVDGFTISALVASNNLNAVGVFVTNAGGARLSHNVIITGTGGAGTNGTVSSNGLPGGTGSAGVNGCDGCSGGGNPGPGGSSSCSRPGGVGGGGGYDMGDGASGASGVVVLGGGGSGGAPGVGSVICFDRGGNGQNGGIGANGTVGVAGSSGSGGVLAVGGWTTDAGGAGGNGTDGHGGGGGGGGGGGAAVIVCNADRGGGGGGGGGGGCNGIGGGGGSGGGASIGILAYGAGSADFVSNTINRGNGGVGGTGGAGSAGGVGGSGGNPGLGFDDAGNGGAGGKGGDGGPGGGGGGGAGGPSYGIHAANGTPRSWNNTIDSGSGGLGGPGGLPNGQLGQTGATSQQSGTVQAQSPALAITFTGNGSGTVTTDIGWYACSVDCIRYFAEGSVVTLVATPNPSPGSVFVGWSNGCSGIVPTCAVTLTAGVVATANFALISYPLTVTKSGNGSGSVASSSFGIDCGATCTFPYNIGTVVTLTPTPSPGSVFAGWSGACTGTGACDVTMDAAKDVDASFALMSTYSLILEGWQQAAPYVVTPATGAGGATFNPVTRELTMLLGYSGLTGTETMAHIHGPAARGANAGILYTLTGANPKNQTVVLTPQDATHLLAGNLYINIHTSSYPNGEIRAQIDNLGATVTRVLTVSKAGAGSGTVTGTAEPGTVIGCGSDCTETVPNGKVVALSAAPAAGSAFAGWSGACTGAGACNVTMDAAKSVTATFNVADPPRLANISTRMQVLTGSDVMIGGFVIGGGSSKTVAIVATGPSLAQFGIQNALANPKLTLVRSSDQTVIDTNDDWQTASNQAALSSAGFAPSNALEAALLVDLPPGAYTAIVEGVGGGTGVSVIGVYEVNGPTIPLINISTRGRVLTGNDVMIGGFVIQGSGPQTVAIVATGPSLAQFGIAQPLANPKITLVRSSDQATIDSNDDWQSHANSAQLTAAGFAPSDPLESGIHTTLPPGAYTVVVEGVGGGTGVAVIGVYKVN